MAFTCIRLSLNFFCSDFFGSSSFLIILITVSKFRKIISSNKIKLDLNYIEKSSRAFEKKYEGKIPDRYFDEFLHDMEITKEEFYKIVDKFANKDLFKKDKDGNLLRDNDGNLEKIQSDNI